MLSGIEFYKWKFCSTAGTVEVADAIVDGKSSYIQSPH